MIVPPIPWRCCVGIPASISVRFAISPSTYDSVNFLEPITTSAADEEEAIRKAGTQEKMKEFGTQETSKWRNCFDFLYSWFQDSSLVSFAVFVGRFINSRCRVAR